MLNFFLKGRERGVVLVARPHSMDEILRSSLPYLPCRIPSSVFQSTKMSNLLSQDLIAFESSENMSSVFFTQMTNLVNIHKSGLPAPFKQDYITSLSLAAAYRDKTRNLLCEVEKHKSDSLLWEKKFHKLDNEFKYSFPRLSLLEAQISAKQLCKLYFDEIGHIQSLPDHAHRGVLMVKQASILKAKWRKCAVAILDKFFFVYDMELVCFFVSFVFSSSFF